ncbi:unnamed protein product [Zymoseptoria tritici ST99CH_1A5]|uniref:Uncharacterized protein n=2 Tax=Zymoseptoria tritici TaxID=1047171 RepID=A0A1X7S0M3_ZYMT9|nr:unnamed protein product [Zymoseptoria tritici ST99CH_3D7]SMR59674.1 unnamed protein product [Zymoseptoria tritici ST99CH_3D1]SMY26864.1 unnamed protein product [Zymoseptoria tritici ST99CH_1A5]
MDTFTTDMGNAITREAIASAVADTMASNLSFPNLDGFWWHVVQKLSSEFKIVRTSNNARRVYHAMRKDSTHLPDDIEYARDTLQAAQAATIAANQAAAERRSRLQYDSIETANDPAVRIARQTLALLEQQETEQKAAKEAKEKDDSSGNDLAYRR